MNILGIQITTADELVKITLAVLLAVCTFGIMIAIIGNVIDWFKGADGDDGETGDEDKDTEEGGEE